MRENERALHPTISNYSWNFNGCKIRVVVGAKNRKFTKLSLWAGGCLCYSGFFFARRRGRKMRDSSDFQKARNLKCSEWNNTTIETSNLTIQRCAQFFFKNSKNDELRTHLISLSSCADAHSTPAHSCTLLHTPQHSCALLRTPAHSSTFLHIPAHSCALLRTLTHSCALLRTPAHSCTLLHPILEKLDNSRLTW